ncbi:MAG TPA: DoxX family protein [Vicinamibacteria bacterium]|jgi:putative oxidoreductase
MEATAVGAGRGKEASMFSQVQRAASLGLRVAAALAFLPPLLTRLVIGQAFFQTGRGKLQNVEGVVSFFSELGIPFPAANAAFVSRLEYYGGLLLVVGLLTRLVATGLLSTMAVALLTADRPAFLDALRGVGEGGLTDVTPVVYGLFLLWLIVAGPGAVSLDALASRWLKPTPETVADPRAA